LDIEKSKRYGNSLRQLRIAPDGGDTPSAEQSSGTQSSVEGVYTVQ